MRKYCPTLLSTTFSILAITSSAYVYALEQETVFNIPSQSLALALQQYSKQTNVVIDVDSKSLVNKKSTSLKGNYSKQEALEILLEGTQIYTGKITATGQVTLVESNITDTVIITASPSTITRTMEISSQQISSIDISKTPQTNSSITGLLKSNPNVQFSESSNTSNNPGELAPETVSFHGEKFYNNNFIIDGISNNDRLNPGNLINESTNSPNGYQPNDIGAGHPEAFWVPTNLVESVSVFDSNISAKYGQFTGGVVDAQLKEPSFIEQSGFVSWRGSRDSWVRYHIDESNQEEFEKGNKLYNQPQFSKNFYSISVSQPLSDDAGLMVAYTRQQSKIPYWQSILGYWDDQERLSETYLLKGTWQADTDNKYNLTLMYSPHSSTFVRNNMVNSDFSAEGGGYNINWQWDNRNQYANVKTKIAWKMNENSIKDHQNYYNWKITDSINWYSNLAKTYALEGGYGDRDSKQQGWIIKQDWDFIPVSFWGSSHDISTGFDLDISKASYFRSEDAYNYAASTVNSSIVCNGSSACIDGEQYYKQRTVYGKESTSVQTNTYGFYLQDQINLDRLTITPGIRFDYDDYMKNFNISPRFAGIYDVWGDSSTELFGGVNRYYAGNILAYKLREARKLSYIEKRDVNADGTLGDWYYSKDGSIIGSRYRYNYAELNTPYSDEINLGFRQKFYDTVWTAKWVYRKGKDQFAAERIKDTTDNKYYYYMNNDGSSSSNSYTLTIEPITPVSWQNINLSWLVGGSITRNRSSNGTYDDTIDDSIVMYQNNLTSKYNLPASDYNRPWTAFVQVNTEFTNLNLDWTNRLSLIGPYRSLEKVGTVDCSTDSRCTSYSGTFDEYDEVNYGNSISWDWRFSYSLATFNKQKLVVGLDVINVLDRSNQLSKDSYSLGRQFWLDVTYTW